MSEQPVTSRASSCGVGESCNSVEEILAVLRLESRNDTSIRSASDGIDLAHVTNIDSNPEALRGMGKPTAIASAFASSEDTNPIFTAEVSDITGNSSDIPPGSTGSKDTNSATKTFRSSDPAVADNLNDADDIDNSPQVLLEYRPRADGHAASRIKNQWDWLKWLYNPNTSPDFSEIEHLGYDDIVLTPQQAASSGEFPDGYQVPSQKVPLHDIESFGRRPGSITDTYPRHDISHEQPHHASSRRISNNGVTQPLDKGKNPERAQDDSPIVQNPYPPSMPDDIMPNQGWPFADPTLIVIHTTYIPSSSFQDKKWPAIASIHFHTQNYDFFKDIHTRGGGYKDYELRNYTEQVPREYTWSVEKGTLWAIIIALETLVERVRRVKNMETWDWDLVIIKTESRFFLETLKIYLGHEGAGFPQWKESHPYAAALARICDLIGKLRPYLQVSFQLACHEQTQAVRIAKDAQEAYEQQWKEQIFKGKVEFDVRDLLAFLTTRVDQQKTVPLDISTMARALSETEEEEKGVRQELIACLERKREMKSERKWGEESEAYDVGFENMAANHQKEDKDSSRSDTLKADISRAAKTKQPEVHILEAEDAVPGNQKTESSQFASVLAHLFKIAKKEGLEVHYEQTWDPNSPQEYSLLQKAIWRNEELWWLIRSKSPAQLHPPLNSASGPSNVCVGVSTRLSNSRLDELYDSHKEALNSEVDARQNGKESAMCDAESNDKDHISSCLNGDYADYSTKGDVEIDGDMNENGISNASWPVDESAAVNGTSIIDRYAVMNGSIAMNGESRIDRYAVRDEETPDLRTMLLEDQRLRRAQRVAKNQRRSNGGTNVNGGDSVNSVNGDGRTTDGVRAAVINVSISQMPQISLLDRRNRGRTQTELTDRYVPPTQKPSGLVKVLLGSSEDRTYNVLTDDYMGPRDSKDSDLGTINEHRSSQRTIANAGTLQLFPTRVLSLQADSIDRATEGGILTVAKSETNLRETRRDIDTVVDGESRLQELEGDVDGLTEGDQAQSNMAIVHYERRPLWRLDRADLADRGMSPERTAEIAQKAYVSTSSRPDVEEDRVRNGVEVYSERRVDWLRGHAEHSLSPRGRAMAQRGRLPRLLPYGQPHPRNPFRYFGTQHDLQVLEDNIAKLSLRNRP